MAFPNLPFFIDDDVRISESLAITRFVCQKYRPEYLGRTLQEQAMAHEFLNITHNCKIWEVVIRIFPPNFAENMNAVMEAIENWVQKLAKARGSNKFICGNEPTYADFYAHEVIYLFYVIDESLQGRHPELVEF
jgi:glutathione S-transferase